MIMMKACCVTSTLLRRHALQDPALPLIEFGPEFMVQSRRDFAKQINIYIEKQSKAKQNTNTSSSVAISLFGTASPVARSFPEISSEEHSFLGKVILRSLTPS